MAKSLGVRFHIQDKIYDFDQVDFIVARGDKVIVETDQGVEMGTVVYADKDVKEETLEAPLKPILRKATTSDIDKMDKYNEKKKEAVDYFREAIEKYDLPMKPVDAHFAFDGSKITMFFTAESRVDFRELVKDLTRRFQKSIRLQQVGIRDVAKELGGIGMCGREVCCSVWLEDMSSITTDMARLQQMAHRGSERISGLCGRLMCCLSYEAEFYMEMSKQMPELDAIVTSPQGKGKVVDLNVLKQMARLRLESDEEMEFPVKELKW